MVQVPVVHLNSGGLIISQAEGADKKDFNETILD